MATIPELIAMTVIGVGVFAAYSWSGVERYRALARSVEAVAAADAVRGNSNPDEDTAWADDIEDRLAALEAKMGGGQQG